jgi:hypothetical protein
MDIPWRLALHWLHLPWVNSYSFGHSRVGSQYCLEIVSSFVACFGFSSSMLDCEEA